MNDHSGRSDEAGAPPAALAKRRSKAARLFDVRRVIGGLFVVYGLILLAVGAFDTQEEIAKAAGLRINLWEGAAMLGFGALFLLWQWWRPVVAPEPTADGSDASQPNP